VQPPCWRLNRKRTVQRCEKASKHSRTALVGNTSAVPAGVSLSDLNNVVDSINNNFDGGAQNSGFLNCP
jgi:hypothetical protein